MKAQMEAEVKAVPTPVRSDQPSSGADPDADTIPGDLSVGQSSQPSSVDGSPQTPSPPGVVDKAPAPAVEQVEVEQPPSPAVDQPVVPLDTPSSVSPMDEPEPSFDPKWCDPVSWLLLSLGVLWGNRPFQTILMQAVLKWSDPA